MKPFMLKSGTRCWIARYASACSVSVKNAPSVMSWILCTIGLSLVSHRSRASSSISSPFLYAGVCFKPSSLLNTDVTCAPRPVFSLTVSHAAWNRDFFCSAIATAVVPSYGSTGPGATYPGLDLRRSIAASPGSIIASLYSSLNALTMVVMRPPLRLSAVSEKDLAPPAAFAAPSPSLAPAPFAHRVKLSAASFAARAALSASAPIVPSSTVPAAASR